MPDIPEGPPPPPPSADAPTSNVVLKDPVTGEIVRIPDDANAAQVVRERGLQVPTTEEINLWDREQKYGGAGQTALAAGETVLRSATLGAVPGFGAEEDIRGRQAVLEREHPAVSVAAQAVPDIAAAAVSGGLSGVATGAGRAAIEEAGGSLLKHELAALGAESFTQGAMHEANNSYVQNRDFSPTALLADTIANFTVGAGLLGAAHGVMGGSHWLSEAREAAGEAGRSLPGGEGVAADVPTGGLGAMAVEDLSNPKYAGAVIELGKQAPDIRRVVATNVADNLDTLETNMREGISWSLKADDVARHADDWTPEMMQAQAKNIEEVTDRGGAALLDDLSKLKDTGYGEFGARAQLALDDIGRARQRVLDSGDGASLFINQDLYKKQLDKSISYLDDTRGMRADPHAQKMWVDRIRQDADAAREGLQRQDLWGKAALEQREINAGYSKFIDPLSRVQQKLYEKLKPSWGDVGRLGEQRRGDPERIVALLSKDPEFRKGFDSDLQAALAGVDEAAQARLTHGYSQDPALEAVKKTAQSLRDDFDFATTLKIAENKAPELEARRGLRDKLVGALAEHGAGVALTGLPVRLPYVKKLAGGLLQKLSKEKGITPGNPIAEQLSRAFERYSANPQMSDPLFLANRGELSRGLLQRKGALQGVQAAAGPPVPGATELARGASMAQGSSPAGVTAALGGAAVVANLSDLSEAATPNSDHLQTVQTVNHVVSALDAEIDRHVAQMLSDDREPTSIQKSARAANQSVAMARFVEDRADGDPLAVWRKQLDALRSRGDNPEAALEELTNGWGSLPAMDPGAYQQIASQVVKIRGYLMDNIPQPTGQSMVRPEGFPPTMELLRQYAAKFQGAALPKTVIADMAAGVASPIAIQAMKENWPPLYLRTQISAAHELQNQVESGESIPAWKRNQLDRDLGMGEMLGILHSPRLAGILSQAPKPHQPPQGALPGGSRLGQNLTPGALQTLSGG